MISFGDAYKRMLIALRWAANFVTGNSFRRIERRLTSIEKKIDLLLRRSDSSAVSKQTHAMIRTLFDDKQEHILRKFNDKTRVEK